MTDTFTHEERIYFRYLRRRLNSGESGSRAGVKDVLSAHNKFEELLLVNTESAVEVTPELQGLCDILCVDLSKYTTQGGEDAPA